MKSYLLFALLFSQTVSAMNQGQGFSGMHEALGKAFTYLFTKKKKPHITQDNDNQDNGSSENDIPMNNRKTDQHYQQAYKKYPKFDPSNQDTK